VRLDVFNRARGDRPNSRFPNIVVVITDGQSNEGTEQTQAEAAKLREVAEVFVIGVTNQIDEQELLVGLHCILLSCGRSLKKT